jgi:hypothetical protein
VRSGRCGRCTSSRDSRQLVKVFGEPCGVFGEMYKTVLDHRGLACMRMILPTAAGTDHGVQAVLDQLCAESLALDQYQTRLEGLALIAHRPLELWILHALAQHVRQIKVLALDPPAGADAEIAEIARLVGMSQRCAIRSNFSRPLVGHVIPEPRRLDHGRRPAAPRLLVLAGKIVFADRAADLLDGRQRLALGVRCHAAPSGTRVPAELSIERVGPLRLETFQLATRRLARRKAPESGSDSYRLPEHTPPYREGSASGIVGRVRVM